MLPGTINGIRLHYEVSSQGDPVLMINGLSAPAAYWALQVKALAPHFRVVTFDNRGVGETLCRARLAVLPRGHAFFIEQLDAFNRAVIRFLKSVRSK